MPKTKEVIIALTLRDEAGTFLLGKPSHPENMPDITEMKRYWDPELGIGFINIYCRGLLAQQVNINMIESITYLDPATAKLMADARHRPVPPSEN